MKKIRLNKEFYTKEAIESAKKEFDGFCDITLEEDAQFYNITITTKDDTAENIEYTFSNICLANMK